jgi:hypothetical protein
MRYPVCFLLFLACLQSTAQSTGKTSTAFSHTGSEKYFSFNPFGLLEGEMAIGAGFGNRFSERSEYFSELSYLGQNPLYEEGLASLHGFRLIVQYRYYFLQQWRPVFNWQLQRKRARTHPFIGLEFRTKPYDFSGTNHFINSAAADTLMNYRYKARATILGGAVVLGATRNIRTNGRFKIEITIGVGVKQKLVRFKNVPQDYQPLIIRSVDWGFPTMYESVTAPYIPIAIRLRYVIS